MATATDFYGRANAALNTSGKEMIAAAQELYRKLHVGFIGSGVTRIPIAGDTTKLHLAAGLSPLQKNWLALLPSWHKTCKGSNNFEGSWGTPNGELA